MRLLHLLSALFLLSLAAPAVAAPDGCAPRTIALSDVPMLVTDLRAQALRAGSPAPCPDYLLRVAIDWTEAVDGSVSLSAVQMPFAAVDLQEIALRDQSGRIIGRRDVYSLTPGQTVPRPRARTAAELADCRRAILPYQADFCDTPIAEFAIEIVNRDDIALDRRVPATNAQKDRARLTGLFLQVAFRLEPELLGRSYNAVEVVAANLTGVTIVDGTGAVMAAGRSSDLLPERQAKARPQWLQKPTGQQVSRVYPDRALRQNIGGRTVVTCRVGHFGWLRRCEVVSESPPDYGFGDAAKRLMRGLQAAPSADGEDFIGATVRVPFNFRTADSEEQGQQLPPPGPDGGPPPGTAPALAPPRPPG